MKILKTVLLLTTFTFFACTTDDEGDSQSGLPEQGNVSLALSNGGGFVVENMQASVSALYDTSNTPTITITGTAGNTGTILITIVDNDNDFMALVNENAIPIGNTALSFYATVDYQSDNFTMEAGAGTLEIISYEEFGNQNYAELSATFSAAGNFNTITSSILDVILSCESC